MPGTPKARAKTQTEQKLTPKRADQMPSPVIQGVGAQQKEQLPLTSQDGLLRGAHQLALRLTERPAVFLQPDSELSEELRHIMKQLFDLGLFR